MKRHTVQWLRHLGCAAYTRLTLSQLYTDLLTHIQQLGGHDALSALIGQLQAPVSEDDRRAREVGEGQADADNPLLFILQPIPVPVHDSSGGGESVL